MTEREKHISEYLILFIGFVVLFIMFYLFKYNRLGLYIIGGVSPLFYVLWGILHHAVEGRLNKLIAMEYILVGILVFFLVYTVISI